MGKNGCGKSTLLKIIAGILTHTEGEIKYSHDIKISYMPDIFPALPFRVEEYLMHMGAIQGLVKSEIEGFIVRHFNVFNMPQDTRHKKISACSKGTRQKVNIMQALITKPDLLILDEPFAGLDEHSTDRFIDMLNALAADGVALVIACHEKVLAQRITERIYMFHDKQCHISKSYEKRYSINVYASKQDANLDALKDRMISINTSGELSEFTIEAERLKETVAFLVEHGYEIHSINLKQI